MRAQTAAFCFASRQRRFTTSLLQTRRNFASDKNTVCVIETPTRDGQWMLPTMIHQHREASNSPPILLVAGWCGVAGDWGALPKLLGARTNRHVITYDARGMGNAKPFSDGFEFLSGISLTQMAQDAMDVLSSVTSHCAGGSGSQQSFGVGGVSMGGMVAQLVAGASRGLLTSLKEPAPDYKISSLVLLSTTPGGHATCDKTDPPCPTFLSSFDNWLDHHDCPHTLEQTNRDCAHRFFSSLGDDFLRRPGRRKLREKLVDSFLKTRSQFSTSAARSIIAQRQALSCEKFDTRGFLPMLDIPTLVVHGEQDRVISVDNALLLHELIGHTTAQLEVISSADHLLWITHGLEICEIVGDFYLSLDE